MHTLDTPKLAIIGLGYVGLPLAVEFAKKRSVVGFDINQARIDALKTGHDATLEVSDEELAEATGLSSAQVLKFANMADLYRIHGVGSDYAQLLEAAGVDTVPALARRAPANLAATLAQVNEEKKLTRRVPPEADVAKWVEQAKELPRVLEY